MEFFLKSIHNVITLTHFKKLFLYFPSHIHTGQDTQWHVHPQPPSTFVSKCVGFFYQVGVLVPETRRLPDRSCFQGGLIIIRNISRFMTWFITSYLSIGTFYFLLCFLQFDILSSLVILEHLFSLFILGLSYGI